MIIPNSHYVAVEISQEEYQKQHNFLLGERREYAHEEMPKSWFEGTVYASGDTDFSQNPVGAAPDNQFIFARVPDPMGLKKGDRVIVNHSPVFCLVHNGHHLVFVYKEGVVCIVRDDQEEINLFNREMPPLNKTSDVLHHPV